jgi:peptidoglycan/LPS O-acetylase OafA/YrhL
MDGIALGCLVAMISAKIKLGDKANLALRIVGALLCLLIIVFRGTASRLALYKVGLDVTVLGIGTALLLIALQKTFEASGSRPNSAPASGNKFAAARKAIFRSTSFLRWFGRNSYEVYLTHMLVVWPMVLLFLYFRLSINWSPLWFLIATALAGVCGYLVARFYSEPLNHWLRVKSMPAKGKTAAVAGD